MGIRGKLEVEVDIKSCGDLFHELCSSKLHQVSQITPAKVHSCEVHEGDFEKPGSVIFWNYTHDGKKCVAKEVIEAIDKANRLVRFKVIEGDVLKEFKSLAITVEVTPKGDITTAKWTAEFEKIADDGPYPTKIMDLFISVTKDIEAHHLKA